MTRAEQETIVRYSRTRTSSMPSRGIRRRTESWRRPATRGLREVSARLGMDRDVELRILYRIRDDQRIKFTQLIRVQLIREPSWCRVLTHRGRADVHAHVLQKVSIGRTNPHAQEVTEAQVGVANVRNNDSGHDIPSSCEYHCAV
jgi:hypothetical protein